MNERQAVAPLLNMKPAMLRMPEGSGSFLLPASLLASLSSGRTGGASS
jgi:hypothetical protein